MNERLNDSLCILDGGDMVEAYREVTDRAAGHFDAFDAEYADHFIKARDAWLAQF